ncbi:hypothetical protein KM043_008154 [Ampulex compressa]|nr:hypothetical protein KM043_008154 [Ampulex compressa]
MEIKRADLSAGKQEAGETGPLALGRWFEDPCGGVEGSSAGRVDRCAYKGVFCTRTPSRSESYVSHQRVLFLGFTSIVLIIIVMLPMLRLIEEDCGVE